MLLDKNVFSNAQVLSVTGTTAATNVIDTESTDPNLGAGTPIWLVTRVNTAFSSGTAATFTVHLTHCATSGGTYLDLLVSAAYTLTQLVKGFDLLTVPLPAVHQRYLAMSYVQAGGSAFNGATDAFLTTAAPRHTGAWGT
jgi:Bbp16